jgi:hypothetical protein
MRSAGCIINDMWDKDFDGKVAFAFFVFLKFLGGYEIECRNTL